MEEKILKPVKNINTSEYDIYQSSLCDEEKCSFNLKFPARKLLHGDTDGIPSLALIDWIELNKLPDKLEEFYLWGNAMYAAIQYWDGNKNYLRNTFDQYRDSSIKISDKQLEEILGQCNNIIEVATFLLKVLGTELYNIGF